MGINPMKWKTRTVAYTALGILLLYVLFIHTRTYEVTVTGTLKNSNPEHVWEYVADFSNMKTLNPTIEDFDIIEESGNYDHWKYSVKYTEHLSHMPAVKNTALGHFSILREKDDFVINSQHRTCFFANFGCLDSTSQFKFSGSKGETKCLETVKYECPMALSNLCDREVRYQRQEIMKNLKAHFTKKSVPTLTKNS
ncbi:uncharacterized protein LOC105701530 [Orussus abietinus]|uniref:uncharacterized protein LOC105701530 n=1 Tax=Orussus abietinus TaxID=222816 RepID=UPI000626C08E|nr:uncharacterized protein LOC105701530 [Orussus abietinus]XP_012283768.1 uncharacterized protein LOC105701530 [Orussus abietinus]